MLKIFKPIFFIIFIAAYFIHAQGKFEGKVVFQVTDDGEKQKIEYLVKDKKFKIKPPEGQGMGDGSMIYDAEKKAMYIIMNEQKMYMEMPIDVGKEMLKEDNDKMQYFTKGGEVKNLNGYDCDKFIFKDDQQEGVAWMTQELGSFMFMGDPKDMDGASGWQKEILGAGYFPMLVEELDDSGNLVEVFRVLELVPMDLDSKIFTIPSGFKKFDMPQMKSGDDYR
jgi:hypothetical protein